MADAPRVGIVIASHSAALAEGVAELARQMAPDVVIQPAGGADDDSIGTSFDRITAAIEAAGSEAIVLFDLGSAQMTAELAVEAVPGGVTAQIVDAPLVEGAIAAAVAAQGGGSMTDVAAAAIGAAQLPGATATEGATDEPTDANVVERTVRLRNPLGLHARPAAELVRRIDTQHAKVLIGRPGDSGVDVRSVLGLVRLGMRGGDEMHVRATGRDAQAAVDQIVAAAEAGFGELGTDGPVAGAPAPAAPSAPAAATPPAAAATTPPAATADLDGKVLRGVGAVPGRVLGTAIQLRAAEPVIPDDAQSTDTAFETAALRTALAAVDAELAGEPGDISAAHRALLGDPTLQQPAFDAIAAGRSAAVAWWSAIGTARKSLATATDALIAERAADVTDVGLRVLARLRPDLVDAAAVPAELAGTIVCADDVVPSTVARLVDAGAVGLALARGGVTSHVVVIARGLGLPTVVGVGAPLTAVPDKTTLILDGAAGTVTIDPDPAVVEEVQAAGQAEQARRQAEQAAAHGPVVTQDGRRIIVAANVGSAAEARAARIAGADGIGLLRTEFMFLNRQTLPSEEEQITELRAILAEFPEHPVVIRTLDVGGDKQVPALGLDPIANGFLGVRGIRYGLAHPDLLRTQLRAIMRAAAGWGGELSVMAPLVAVVAEVEEFRIAVESTQASLRRDGLAYSAPMHVGVMVEVPTAAIAAAEICAVADFVSVGSNDLIQYLFAADRTNPAVAGLYQPEHPAVWRVLEWLTEAAQAAHCPVAVCGEIAANPAIARQLVALGVDELSMAASAVPQIKAALR